MNRSFAIAQVVIKEMYRRKDFYVLFVLIGLITLLLGSINFFNDSRIVRYLKEISLSLIWLAGLVITVAAAARQIPNEREQRTLYPLLAKPVSRSEVIIGKFLGCWLAMGIALSLFYLFFTLIAGFKEQAWPLVQYFQALWLHWIFAGVVTAFVIFGSLIFAAPSSTITITFIMVLGIMLLGRSLHKIALQQAEPLSSILYALYYLMPHLEFFDIRDLIVHSDKLVPWWAVGAASGYGLIYMAIFLTAACIAFRRKMVI